MATKPAPKPIELPTDKLRWRCELSRIPFETTAQADPREGFIGQERALRALKMGVEKSRMKRTDGGMPSTDKRARTWAME